MKVPKDMPIQIALVYGLGLIPESAGKTTLIATIFWFLVVVPAL